MILTEDILDVADPDIADGIILHAKGLGLPIRRLKRLTSFGLEDLAACFVTILQAEAWESNKALFERYSATIEPGIAERLRKGAALSSSEVDQARKMREMFRAQMADVFAGAAPLALPTITTRPR